MTYRDAKTLSAREQVQMKFATRAARLVNVYQCLVVSTDSQRLELLEQAASRSGWKTFLCADVTTALSHFNRSLVQLAIVDLEAQQPAAFQPLVEQLTARSGLLVIVCGNEGQIDEEVWIRQLGAWLYLPGMPDVNNFTMLCGEARHIAERLAKAPEPSRDQPLPVAQRQSYS